MENILWMKKYIIKMAVCNLNVFERSLTNAAFIWSKIQKNSNIITILIHFDLMNDSGHVKAEFSASLLSLQCHVILQK